MKPENYGIPKYSGSRIQPQFGNPDLPISDMDSQSSPGVQNLSNMQESPLESIAPDSEPQVSGELLYGHTSASRSLYDRYNQPEEVGEEITNPIGDPESDIQNQMDFQMTSPKDFRPFSMPDEISPADDE